MIIERSSSFKKAYRKRIVSNSKLVKAATYRIQLFGQNPTHPLLRDHALTGALHSYRSFSITGDLRIIYQRIDESTVCFLDIGTHNQVY